MLQLTPMFSEDVDIIMTSIDMKEIQRQLAKFS
jgi:hypothetical protein